VVVLVLSVLIVVGVIAALLATPLRDLLNNPSGPRVVTCIDGSPCQAATNFLAAFGGGDYEAMYNLTSSASHTRFNSPDILKVSPSFQYKDAHDYIVTRTKTILSADFADVTSIQTSIGQTKAQSDSQAQVSAHVVMTSGRVGSFAQDITIPLVIEQGKWLVDWTPGLIFKQLDDPADPNYRRKITFTPDASAARGTIFDRDGNALAKDDTVYDVNVDTSRITNEASLDNALAADLNMTPAQVKAAYKAGKPVRTISKDYYATISNALNSLPGVSAHQHTGRVYPYGTDTAAVTGYALLDNADCLKAAANAGVDTSTYGPGDYSGCSGVELWAEKYLRATTGGTLQIVERNADGTDGAPVATIATRQGAPGADVHTTIALKDQQTAYGMLKLYQNYGGGAFAVEPSNGAVLVMASYPACDPNDFSLGFGPGIAACTSATDGRALNRALTSQQPIGSAFKVVTLSAALEHNVVTPTETLPCRGSYLVTGETTPRTDPDSTKPATTTAPGALGPSCDVTYWLLSDRLNHADPTFLPTMAKAFGYGAATKIVGMPEHAEQPGLVPDPQWLQANENATWTPTDAANLGIGQGFFLATPAQVAMVAAEIANNGVRMQPRLVTTITSADGTLITSFDAKQAGKLPISSQNLTILQNALLGPTSPGGTAYSSFRNFAIPVAGKTGTAETPNPRPHSWFMSYAPAAPSSLASSTSPIATGVLVEHSTFGEYCAVPMTLQILRAHFNQSGNPDPGLVTGCEQHITFP
jgi:penicillin-binding protein 2